MTMVDSDRGNQPFSSSSSTQITLALKGLKQPPESGLIDVKLLLTIAPEVGAAVKPARHTLGTSSQTGSLIGSHAAKMVAKTIEVRCSVLMSCLFCPRYCYITSFLISHLLSYPRPSVPAIVASHPLSYSRPIIL